MKTISSKILALLLVFLVAGGVSCVLETKVIEIVVTGTTCVDYEEDEETENFTTPKYLNYADEIDQILEDNGLSREAIASAVVVSASYEVTDFPHTHDWIISGAITVERNDTGAGPDTIISYTSVSLEDALGVITPAQLHSAGVELLNDALQEYIDDVADPELTFTVVNGDVGPTDPSPSDRLVFYWTACITIQVVLEEEYEVPELF